MICPREKIECLCLSFPATYMYTTVTPPCKIEIRWKKNPLLTVWTSFRSGDVPQNDRDEALIWNETVQQ